MKNPEFTLVIGDIEHNLMLGVNQCKIEMSIANHVMKSFIWAECDTLSLITKDKTKAIQIKKPYFLMNPLIVHNYLGSGISQLVSKRKTPL